MATLVITPEMEADAKLLARYTGMTPQAAAADAIRKQIQLVQPTQDPRRIDWDAVDALVDSLQEPVDRSLTDDEVIGYDEHGLPS